MMKIVIFGATGSIGRELVPRALDRGYQVSAFVRDAGNSFTETDHENLRLFEGDVLDPEAVSEAIEGQDAVICVLGAGRKGGVRAPGTKNMIDAMKQHGVRRLICQSTLGAGESRKNLNFFWKYIMFGWLLKEAYKDHQLQEEYVKNSGLHWTIVRPAAFTDGPATGTFRHGFGPEEKNLTFKISRADVALFLLQQLESGQYIRKTPGLSY